MTEVAAFITTMSFFASAETSPAPSASGVNVKPARMSTLIAHDQFLRETLGNVGIRAPGVFADDFDLLAGNCVAMLFDIKLDGIVHLRRGISELARIGHDQSDLDGLLRVR